jgi:hypothetical protein
MVAPLSVFWPTKGRDSSQNWPLELYHESHNDKRIIKNNLDLMLEEEMGGVNVGNFDKTLGDVQPKVTINMNAHNYNIIME